MVDPRVKPFPWSNMLQAQTELDFISRLVAFSSQIEQPFLLLPHSGGAILRSSFPSFAISPTFCWHLFATSPLHHSLLPSSFAIHHWLVLDMSTVLTHCNDQMQQSLLLPTINPCFLHFPAHNKQSNIDVFYTIVSSSFSGAVSFVVSRARLSWSLQQRIDGSPAKAISNAGTCHWTRVPRLTGRQRAFRQSATGFQVRCHRETTTRQELLSSGRETSHHSSLSSVDLSSMSRTRTSSSRMSTEAPHRTTTARTVRWTTKVGITLRRDTVLISLLSIGNWKRFSRHSIRSGTNVWPRSKADRRWRRRTNKWRRSAKIWSVSLNSFINRTHSCRNNSACWSTKCNNFRSNRQQSPMDIEEQNRVDESRECLDVDCFVGEIKNKCRNNCDTEHRLRSLFNHVMINRKKGWNESLECLFYCWEPGWILWPRKSLWNTCRRVWRKTLPLSVWT